VTTLCIIQPTGPGDAVLAGPDLFALDLLLRRLARCPVDGVAVVLGGGAADPAVRICEDRGVPILRCDRGDARSHLLAAVERWRPDDLVRITTSCPLTDRAVVTEALRVHREMGAAYTSNTLLRSFPRGLDVEIVRTAALTSSSEAGDRPTAVVYRHPERHTLAGFRAPVDAATENWAVTTASDLRTIEAIASRVSDPVSAHWMEFLDLWGRRARPAPGAVRLRPAGSADGRLLLAWRNDPDAVRFSLTGRAVGPVEHKDWLAARLDRPGVRIWIGIVDELPVGHIRIEVTDAVATVSLGLDPRARGHGHGTAMLELVQSALREDRQADRIDAMVHRDNRSSLITFERAGFTLADDGLFNRLVWSV
jgi:spore coat polysaccharide biosynthesis protein SpsF